MTRGRRVPSGEPSRDHAKHIYFISISISKSRVVVGMTFLALVCLRQKFTFFLPADWVAQVDGRGVWSDFFVQKRI